MVLISSISGEKENNFKQKIYYTTDRDLIINGYNIKREGPDRIELNSTEISGNNFLTSGLSSEEELILGKNNIHFKIQNKENTSEICCYTDLDNYNNFRFFGSHQIEPNIKINYEIKVKDTKISDSPSTFLPNFNGHPVLNINNDINFQFFFVTIFPKNNGVYNVNKFEYDISCPGKEFRAWIEKSLNESIPLSYFKFMSCSQLASALTATEKGTKNLLMLSDISQYDKEVAIR